MTTTPTPEEFLALTDPEDDVDEVPQDLVTAFKTAWHTADAEGRAGHRTEAGLTAVLHADPLQSIAESLRAIAADYTGTTFFEAELQSTDDNELQERYDRLDQEYADLEDKHRSLYELLAEVEKIIKPSTSKLANSVREAITQWRNPAVPADIDPEEPADPDVDVVKPLQTPAHDASVEEWRDYAINRGYTLPYVETMNRSQIRTMLGIEQPVEDPA